MIRPYGGLLVVAAVTAVVAVNADKFSFAQQPTADVIGELASNEGIFIDGKTFKIAKGKSKGDPSAQIARLSAKEIGPGAIVFRYRDKLYMVEGTPPGANVQAMKSFQDDWNASYMNSVKDFQDNWSTSYMK